MRNLIIVRAGDRSLHPRWLDKSTVPRFDLFVSYFGDCDGKYSDSATYFESVKGLKYPVIHELLAKCPELLTSYDAIWMPDDDLLINTSSINRMFAMFHEYRLWLAQPALGPRSYFQRQIQVSMPGVSIRFTNFAEIMCPIFSSAALLKVRHTFCESKSGWGIDYVWPRLLGNPIDRIAFLDATPVIHTRPYRRGSFYRLCARLGVRPKRECRLILRKYRISNRNICVYSTQYERDFQQMNHEHERADLAPSP